MISHHFDAALQRFLSRAMSLHNFLILNLRSAINTNQSHISFPGNCQLSLSEGKREGKVPGTVCHARLVSLPNYRYCPFSESKVPASGHYWFVVTVSPLFITNISSTVLLFVLKMIYIPISFWAVM